MVLNGIFLHDPQSTKVSFVTLNHLKYISMALNLLRYPSMALNILRYPSVALNPLKYPSMTLNLLRYPSMALKSQSIKIFLGGPQSSRPITQHSKGIKSQCTVTISATIYLKQCRMFRMFMEASLSTARDQTQAMVRSQWKVTSPTI